MAKVALAARLCAPQREQASLLSLCFAWCQCVHGVLFLSSLDFPSPTGKRGWVKLGGRDRGEGWGYLGMGEGLQHIRFPSFPNPGNHLLASVSEMFFFHVTGLQSLRMCVGCDLQVCYKTLEPTPQEYFGYVSWS